MKKKNNTAGRRPSYAFLFVLLLAVILLFATVLWQFFKINTLYSESQTEIESISSALDELVEYSKNTPANTDAPEPGISVKITYPKDFASDSSLEGLLNTIQAENARSLSAINNLLLVLSIIMPVVVIAIPIFNYAFIQKGQLQEIRKRLDEVKEYSKELEQYKEKYADLERRFNEIIEEKTSKVFERLAAYVKQAAVINSNLAFGTKDNPTESIEPVSDSPEDRAQALALDARIDFAKDRFEDAIRKITDAIHLVETNADYYDTRSFMYFETGNFEEARADAASAIYLEPQNTRYYLRRSVALHALRRFEEALEDETEAIRINPTDSACYKQRSTTLCSLRRYDEALRDARKAHDSDKSSKYILAWAMYQNGQYSEALKIVEILPRDCKQYLAFRTRAMSRIKIELRDKRRISKKFVDEIKADLQRAIDLNGKYPYGYIRYAEAMILLKKLPEALEKLNQAQAIDPNEPDVYHWFAEYYRAAGNNEKAKEYDELAKEKGYIPEPGK